MARRRRRTGGDSAGASRRIAQRQRRHAHHSCGLQGGARIRRRGIEIQRRPVDASDARHRREDRLAEGPARSTPLPGRVRGVGTEARTAPPSARPGRALHRQRGDADRGMGLQHRHPHHRAPTVHVAVALRTGRRPRAAPIQLRSGRGWQARRGGREDLRRSVRDRAAKGEFPQSAGRSRHRRLGAFGPCPRKRIWRFVSHVSRATRKRFGIG